MNFGTKSPLSFVLLRPFRRLKMEMGLIVKTSELRAPHSKKRPASRPVSLDNAEIGQRALREKLALLPGRPARCGSNLSRLYYFSAFSHG